MEYEQRGVDSIATWAIIKAIADDPFGVKPDRPKGQANLLLF